MNQSIRFTHPIHTHRSVTEMDLKNLSEQINQLKLKYNVDLEIQLPNELPVIGPTERSPVVMMRKVRIGMITADINNLFASYSNLYITLDDRYDSYSDVESGLFFVKKVPFSMPSEMEHYVTQGGLPYIYVGKDGFIYWMTKEIHSELLKWNDRIDLNQKYQKKIQDAFIKVNQALYEIERQDQQIQFSTLPFKWYSCIKPTKSGLSEKSLGDGHFKRTVQHVFLLESVSVGHFVRDKHKILCTEPKSDIGRDLLLNEISQYALPNAIAGKKPELITCSVCLKRIQSLLKKAA